MSAPSGAGNSGSKGASEEVLGKSARSSSGAFGLAMLVGWFVPVSSFGLVLKLAKCGGSSSADEEDLSGTCGSGLRGSGLA